MCIEEKKYYDQKLHIKLAPALFSPCVVSCTTLCLAKVTITFHNHALLY